MSPPTADLSIPGQYVWNIMFPTGPGAAPDMPDYAFFLYASNTHLPVHRHSHSSLGRAMRLPNGLWQPAELPALAPRRLGFDRAIWGGGILSLAPDDHLLFYTGLNMSNPKRPWMQSIGLARSNSLCMDRWRRRDNPVLKPRLPYHDDDADNPICRDPYPFIGPDGKVHLAFAARMKGKPLPYNACIGHAVAANDEFTGWKLLPPLIDGTGRYSAMKMPQVIHHTNGQWYIFFTARSKHYSPSWTALAGGAKDGLHCFARDDFTSRAIPVNGRGSVRDDAFYRAPRLIGRPINGVYNALGWLDGRDIGVGFVGGLGKTMQIAIDGKMVTASLQ